MLGVMADRASAGASGSAESLCGGRYTDPLRADLWRQPLYAGGKACDDAGGGSQPPDRRTEQGSSPGESPDRRRYDDDRQTAFAAWPDFF